MGSKKLQVWLPVLFAVVMVVGMSIGYQLRENTSMPGFFKMSSKTTMQEVLDLIDMKYVDPVGTDTLSNTVIQQMLTKLDPHSIYIPADDLKDINDDLRGNFGGIGVEFQIFYDTLNVLNVVQGGPSDKAGLQVGDKVIKVNDTANIAGVKMEPDKIRRLLRGESGSIVKVGILRNGKMLSINITRGAIPLPSVDVAYMLNAETGFIHINKFSEVTHREFMEALQKLKSNGLKKLVLDLRGNGGGFLDQSVKIADEFLDGDKLVVYTKGTHTSKYEYKCTKDGMFEKGDLVLLVDEGSASASEVLSGALQDWDRATIIGRRTFGKGLVQEQFGLSNGAALRLTVARYYTPLGRNIQKPYTNGYTAYEEEIYNRFHNGEVLKPDSSRNTGASFKTPKGRVVYGGGGITPDIFVAYDTSSMGREVAKMYRKGTFSNFIYSYFMQHKPQFSTYKQPADLANSYKAGEPEWLALKSFASRDSVDLSAISERDKADVIKRIPAQLARQIWRFEGYYRVMNRSDEFIKKALEVLK